MRLIQANKDSVPSFFYNDFVKYTKSQESLLLRVNNEKISDFQKYFRYMKIKNT
jgi:hypothetical protein